MMKAREEAAAWYARLQAPDCGPAEQEQFQQWLKRRPENAAAYALAESLLRNLSVRASQNAHMQAMAEQALAQGTSLPDDTPAGRKAERRWQHWQPLSMAASVLIAVFLALGSPDFFTTARQTPAHYETASTAQRAFTFDDGTRANLDIDSAVSVNMTAAARDISLLKGRALFDVAHDQQRPFSVSAGSTRVIALGTRFQVQHQDGVTIVTLEEGSVDVVRDLAGSTLRERLRPGDQLRFDQLADQWHKTRVDTDTVTSWSRARHVFRNAALDAALEEVNRYAATKLRLGDPALAQWTVSGNFMLGESDTIATAFEAALPLRVVATGSELILFPVYDDDSLQVPDSAQ